MESARFFSEGLSPCYAEAFEADPTLRDTTHLTLAFDGVKRAGVPRLSPESRAKTPWAQCLLEWAPKVAWFQLASCQGKFEFEIPLDVGGLRDFSKSCRTDKPAAFPLIERSAADLEAALAPQRKAFAECFSRAFQKDPKLKVSFRIRVNLAEAGMQQSFDLEPYDLAQTPLAVCLNEVVRLINLEPTDCGYHFELPLVFGSTREDLIAPADYDPDELFRVGPE